jgi:hypothetical protein
VPKSHFTIDSKKLELAMDIAICKLPARGRWSCQNGSSKNLISLEKAKQGWGWVYTRLQDQRNSEIERWSRAKFGTKGICIRVRIHGMTNEVAEWRWCGITFLSNLDGPHSSSCDSRTSEKSIFRSSLGLMLSPMIKFIEGCFGAQVFWTWIPM